MLISVTKTWQPQTIKEQNVNILTQYKFGYISLKSKLHQHCVTKKSDVYL